MTCIADLDPSIWTAPLNHDLIDATFPIGTIVGKEDSDVEWQRIRANVPILWKASTSGTVRVCVPWARHGTPPTSWYIKRKGQSVTVEGPRTYAQEQTLFALRRSLTNQTPTPEQVNRIELLRELGYAFGVGIVENTLKTRAQAVALTKLEEAVMWAIKAIVMEEP